MSRRKSVLTQLLLIGLVLALMLSLKRIHPLIAERADLFRAATYLTAKLALLSGAAGLMIGFLIGTFGLKSASWLFRAPAQFYVWLICGTPLLVQVLFIYYGLPSLVAGLEINELQAGILALALNMGAYSATVVKAGLDSVPRGQWEAGVSLGLSRFQVLRYIFVPQALQVARAPLFNLWIALLKDTSLVSAIGVAELTLTATRINSETFLPVPTLITVALIYLGMSTLLNLILSLVKTATINRGGGAPFGRSTLHPLPSLQSSRRPE